MFFLICLLFSAPIGSSADWTSLNYSLTSEFVSEFDGDKYEAAVALHATKDTQDHLTQVALYNVMTRQQKKLMLSLDGKQMKADHVGDKGCNIFESKERCQNFTAPPEPGVEHPLVQRCGMDSPFQMITERARTDCFWLEPDVDKIVPPNVSYLPNLVETEELQLNRLRENKTDFQPCDACYFNLDLFACANSYMPCGAFSEDFSLLQRFVQNSVWMADTIDKDPLDVLKDSMPDLIRELVRWMPCRWMCEAVVVTCGCNQFHSFGEMFLALQDQLTIDKLNYYTGSKLSPATFGKYARHVYNHTKVWDKDVCALLMDGDDELHRGVCSSVRLYKEPMNLSLGGCSWCWESQNDNEIGRLVQLKIAADFIEKLTKAVTLPIELYLRIEDINTDEADNLHLFNASSNLPEHFEKVDRNAAGRLPLERLHPLAGALLAAWGLGIWNYW